MTAIREVCKAANCQIKDPITVSYFFFARASAGWPLFFAALPFTPHVCSQFTAVDNSVDHRKWLLIF